MKNLKGPCFCLLMMCVGWTLIVSGLAYAIPLGGSGINDDAFPANFTYRGQKYITAGGTVDVNSGGQGVTVKVDAAGIAWSSANLNGMALTTESLVVTNAGDYFATWHVSIDGTQGKLYLFEVITDSNADPSDGSPVSHDQCHADFDVQANTHMQGSADCIITVAAGEFVYLGVTETGGGAGTNFDIDHGGLTLNQL